MTDKKLTDEEIIKALKCCSNQMYVCTDKQCRAKTSGNAIDFINRQKAEIERLKGSTIVNNIMESQRIKREAKTEAYKEFAERLKDMCEEIIKQDWNQKAAPVSWAHAYSDFIDDIDNLLEEMVGEEE